MKERPIIFSTPMVQAILEGRKSQTRRIVKPTKDKYFGCELSQNELAGEINSGDHENSKFGTIGDLIWVRENWRVAQQHNSIRPIDLNFERGLTIFYSAGGSRSHNSDGVYVNDNNYTQGVPDWIGKVRPSIHMPRLAARIFLEITDVRVERLHDISESDAEAEGCEPYRLPCHPDIGPFKAGYSVLWESINGAGSWDRNQYVWVISFRRID